MSRWSGVLLAVLTVSLGCGGEGGPTKAKTTAAKDGRVFVKNDSRAILDVNFPHPERGWIDTVVEPGQTVDISQTVIQGGAKMTVKIKARSSPDDPNYSHFTPTGQIEVTVRGNVTIRVTGPLLFGMNLLEGVNLTVQ